MDAHSSERAPRAGTDIKVRVLSPRSAGGAVVNVSVSGMLLEIDRPPLVPIGKDIQLQFQLPGAPRAISSRASVVRHEGKNRMGVRFVMMSADDMQLIQRFVATTG